MKSPQAAQLDAIARDLEDIQPVFAVAMSQLAMKQEHFASYATSRGRDRDGKAKRSERVTS